MGGGSSPREERRRDARVAPPGRVRVGSAAEAATIEGGLVDVSAGGLRFRGAAGSFATGTAVRIEILLDEPDRPGAPPRAVLDGTGRVVWVGGTAGEGREVGVRFDRPVRVKPLFPDLRVFA